MRTLLAAMAAAMALTPARALAEELPPATLLLVDSFASGKPVDGESLGRLMALDANSVPKALRAKFQARRLQARALLNDEQGRKKGFFRRMGNDKPAQCYYEQGAAEGVKQLRRMGFEQISEDEEKFLMQKTKCSECELTEDFTLTMYFVPQPRKGAKTVRYLFLSQVDPLMALVASYRAGSAQSTAFFGVGGAGGCR